MSHEITKQPLQEEVLTPSNAKPAVAAKQAKPKRQAASKAVPSKTTVKPKAATPPAAKKSSKTEKPVKPVEANKTPAKGSKKAPSEVKMETAVMPQADKATKAKKQVPKKPKLVRDSFTIPENDYSLFAILKQRAMTAGIEIKKGELLRAAIVMLNSLGDAEFVNAISSIERIKTGRPKK